MLKQDFYKQVAAIKQRHTPEAIQSAGGFNSFLMQMYQAQTGQTVFRTFKAWRDEGYKVRKGESSFPIFSRPINVIRAEPKDLTPDGPTFFGVAHLFHAGQVEPLK